ncbi:ATP-binding protein [Thermococcus aciditolerans]|uniref:ATP-binding protein n=1 Tax=Thermococcus aciditolerans TaxID=2598455 RepID=A0A5C0SNC8_9EURY|nr:ATP-binding protein [Thermococcus aciditolerans]QEK15860.1 ATP-binding protein [Thermococcus aciditolerans]
MFVNRKDELALLESLYSSGKKEVLILYGRRRVGKTELVKRFIREKNAIYFLADRNGLESNARRFYRESAEVLGLPEVEVRDFRETFELIKLKAPERLVVVIDEFSYLLLTDKNTSAVFQHVIDEILDDRFFLILSGSIIGLMEGLMDYGNPLYGRRTAQLKLKPLNFFHVREYFREASIETAVRIYSVTGGVPMYFRLFEGRNFEEELLRVAFSPTSILYEEPEFILREELGDVHRHYLILEAMALGRHRVSEIANFAGIEAKDMPKYLRTLISLELVRREVPVTESERSKKARYYINDNFFAFWFRFVKPNRGRIEIGTFEMDWNAFNTYVGRAFEEVAKQFLIELNRSGKLPFRFTKIGRWWRKGEEIDLVALNERERKALFVEVKWKDLSEREARGILRDLERKAELVGLDGWEKSYGLIARNIDGEEELKAEGWLVWDLGDFEWLREIEKL